MTFGLPFSGISGRSTRPLVDGGSLTLCESLHKHEFEPIAIMTNNLAYEGSFHYLVHVTP